MLLLHSIDSSITILTDFRWKFNFIQLIKFSFDFDHIFFYTVSAQKFTFLPIFDFFHFLNFYNFLWQLLVPLGFILTIQLFFIKFNRFVNILICLFQSFDRLKPIVINNFSFSIIANSVIFNQPLLSNNRLLTWWFLYILVSGHYSKLFLIVFNIF